jgi:hypothetical protein
LRITAHQLIALLSPLALRSRKGPCSANATVVGISAYDGSIAVSRDCHGESLRPINAVGSPPNQLLALLDKRSQGRGIRN